MTFAPDAVAVPLDTSIQAELLNADKTAVAVFLDGVEVSPTRQTTGQITTLRYQPPTPLLAGRERSAALAEDEQRFNGHHGPWGEPE